MQISTPLNIVPSLLLICACASVPALTCVRASERTCPAGPFDKPGIDARDVDGQRHRQDDRASG
jgi:hypothetical protein